jgi:hypothetical protein
VTGISLTNRSSTPRSSRSGARRFVAESTSKANTYCCLGVLRELTGLPKAGEDLEYLDYEKANEIGLSSDSQCELADQNDDGHSFEEIAAYIEGTL